MKTKLCSGMNAGIVALGLAVGGLCWTPATGRAQTTPLPAEAEDVVKLTKAGLGESVILSKIKNDNTPCTLTSDQIIYLNSQGVSQNVINALVQSASAGGVAVPSTAPPAPTVATPPPVPTVEPTSANEPPPVQGAVAETPAPATAPTVAEEPPATYDSFHEQLAPYGNWIQVGGVPVWQPPVPVGWRPYYDAGHWTYTDAGWYWQSDYPWGDIAFHYGRWSYVRPYGWIWTPAYEFAPAWVCWRQDVNDGYCGWAPLPPGALFINGNWWFHGTRCAAGFNFGLSAGFFTFVGFDHFWAPDFRAWVVPHDRVAVIFGHSVFYNHFRYANGRYVNVGLDRARMAHLTGRAIHIEDAHAIRVAEIHTHVIERASDRDFMKGGGHIDATRRIGAERPGEDHGHPADDHSHEGGDHGPAGHGDDHGPGGHGHGGDNH